MTIYGIDYTSRISPTALKAKGAKFVVRYLAPLKGGAQSWKEITAAEYAELRAAGIAVCFVWEAGGSAAAGGYAQGARDARAALDRLAALGVALGGTRPVYFAIDYDAPTAVSVAYINGARSVMGFTRTGVYGGKKQVTACLDARACAWAWQTLAWSYGHWDSRCHIRQVGSSLVGRTVVDDNYAYATDYGQTPAPVAPKPPVVIPPGGGGTGVPVPPLPVVHLSDIVRGKSSTSAYLVNSALVASKVMPKALLRSRWSIASQVYFARYRKAHGGETVAALRFLGRSYGFTVTA